MQKNQKTNKQVFIIALVAAIKNFLAGVVDDCKQAQRELDAVREKMGQRTK